MNRIDKAFEKGSNLLGVYFTAGHPAPDDTFRIAKALDEAGADFIEIGLPFSDPIADGPTIQKSSFQALRNGMNLKYLFQQLEELRPLVAAPVLLMGYINPVLQYGFEDFAQKCREVGVDGLILPDLPMKEYREIYRPAMRKHKIYNILFITPQTSPERIRTIDDCSEGFIYMVSSYATTGAKSAIAQSQLAYFQRVKAMKLKRKLLIGFGISNHETFALACQYAGGAIIGSAFIRHLETDNSEESIKTFIKNIKHPKT